MCSINSPNNSVRYVPRQSHFTNEAILLKWNGVGIWTLQDCLMRDLMIFLIIFLSMKSPLIQPSVILVLPCFRVINSHLSHSLLVTFLLERDKQFYHKCCSSVDHVFSKMINLFELSPLQKVSGIKQTFLFFMIHKNGCLTALFLHQICLFFSPKLLASEGNLKWVTFSSALYSRP